MNITLVLIEESYDIINKIDEYLKDQFDLAVDYTVRLLNSFNYDDGYEINIDGVIVTAYYNIYGDNVRKIDDESDITQFADVIASYFISVKTFFTDNLEVAKRWLSKIDNEMKVISCDFEGHNLAIPQFNDLTMLTIAWSYTKSIVIVFDTEEIKQLAVEWLITTNVKQIWHNALYDLRIIHYKTGKLPKDIEDTQLLAAVYKNHVDVLKRKVGLKSLAGHLYGRWASEKSTFDLYDNSLNENITENLIYNGTGDTSKYNLSLIKYAGVDSPATYFIYDKFNKEKPVPSVETYITSERRYNTENFNSRYYYEFVLKPAIYSIIRMLNNGQHINLKKVEILKEQTEEMKERLTKVIDNTPIVREFQEILDKERVDNFLIPVFKAMKKPKYNGYKNNVAMRTFVVNYWDNTEHKSIKATTIKELGTCICELIISKQFNHPSIVSASNAYEEYECLRQNTNANRIDKINNPQNYVEVGFNPFNYSQLTKLWVHLGLHSDEISKKTGEMSFSKDILKDLSKTTQNEDIRQVLINQLEIANAKMIITTYIPKYIGSTVNDRVYSSIKLMGTISGRLSGSAPKMNDENKDKVGINALTQPSSSSAFAKPVKELFTASPGKILVGIDYNALEDRIIAILSHDKTKISITKDGLDGHSVATCFYWPDKVTKLGLDPKNPSVFFAATDNNKKAKTLRQDSKGISFKLAYLGFPDSHKGGTITQGIYDAYHNEMYPGITDYRVNYAEPTSLSQGYLHLCYGLKLYSDDPKKDIRTLFNALSQGYSVLTMMALTEFDKYIINNNLSNRIAITNTVHDAIYLEIDNNAETIKIVNDVLPKIMSRNFVIDQEIPLAAECDLGYNLYDMKTIKNHAGIEDIKEVLKQLKEKE